MQSIRIVRVLLAASTLTISSLCLAQISNSSSTFASDVPAGGAPVEPKKPLMFDTSAIDKAVDPCTDFYQYSCGNWVKSNPVPADQVRWGRFNELAERNNWLLYQQLVTASKPTAKRSPLEAKYGDFFASCMDTTV